MTLPLPSAPPRRPGPGRTIAAVVAAAVQVVVLLGYLAVVLSLTTDLDQRVVESLACERHPYAGDRRSDECTGRPGTLATGGYRITVGELEEGTSGFGRPLLCAPLTIVNESGDARSVSLVDWSLQGPGDTRSGADLVESEVVEPRLEDGATTTGRVCFADQGAGDGSLRPGVDPAPRRRPRRLRRPALISRRADQSMVMSARPSGPGGYCGSSRSRASTRIVLTAQFRYHLRSAGTTNHGAPSLVVRTMASA